MFKHQIETLKVGFAKYKKYWYLREDIVLFYNFYVTIWCKDNKLIIYLSILEKLQICFINPIILEGFQKITALHHI